MEIKLFDSELKIVDILWKNGDTTDKQTAETLKNQRGWGQDDHITFIRGIYGGDDISRCFLY